MYTVHAPELEPALAWLNTDRPLRLADLRGHVVILDFWTSCCINCMHVLPILAALERRHARDPVVVIGVHSAKFPGEARPERVADAVARYGVAHPVVVDDAMGIWQRYAVRSWPTLVVVRPDGTLGAVAPGEPDAAMLDALVEELLREARANGTLARERLVVHPGARYAGGALRFPGGLAVAPDGRVAIADAGHHRVLVTDRDGRVLACAGTGRAGLVDGDLGFACFDTPQGVAWDGETLWVADTNNHCLRAVDLAEGTVTRVAGTGQMGTAVVRAPVAARACPLRSPWDVLVDDDHVTVSMAGAHQLWRYDRNDGTIAPWAGSGREALLDGPLEGAAFAQPSGIVRAGDALYVADSETSAVRAIDLATGAVRTLAGAGLFEFGDADGARDVARMQHPLDVAAAPDGAVIVADTYNDRLRRVDPATGDVTTLYAGDGERALREPAGLAALSGGGYLVADTGHHRLVEVDADGLWVRAFEVTGAPEAFDDGSESDDAGHMEPPSSALAGFFTAAVVPEGGASAGVGDVSFALTVSAPDGWKFAPGAGARCVLEISRRGDLWELERDAVSATSNAPEALGFVARAEVSALPDDAVESELLAAVDAVLCSSGDGASCVPVRGWFRLPVTLRRDGGGALAYALPLREPS